MRVDHKLEDAIRLCDTREYCDTLTVASDLLKDTDKYTSLTGVPEDEENVCAPLSDTTTLLNTQVPGHHGGGHAWWLPHEPVQGHLGREGQ